MTKDCSWNYRKNYCVCSFHGNSMNNLLPYCGLIDAKIRASDEDLPVLQYKCGCRNSNLEWFLSKVPDLKFIEGQETYYSCMQNEKTGGILLYQGSKDDGGVTQVRVYVNSLPIWFMIVCICILLCLSGLFSGKY